MKNIEIYDLTKQKNDENEVVSVLLSKSPTVKPLNQGTLMETKTWLFSTGDIYSEVD